MNDQKKRVFHFSPTLQHYAQANHRHRMIHVITIFSLSSDLSSPLPERFI